MSVKKMFWPPDWIPHFRALNESQLSFVVCITAILFFTCPSPTEIDPPWLKFFIGYIFFFQSCRQAPPMCTQKQIICIYYKYNLRKEDCFSLFQEHFLSTRIAKRGHSEIWLSIIVPTNFFRPLIWERNSVTFLKKAVSIFKSVYIAIPILGPRQHMDQHHSSLLANLTAIVSPE